MPKNKLSHGQSVCDIFGQLMTCDWLATIILLPTVTWYVTSMAHDRNLHTLNRPIQSPTNKKPMTCPIEPTSTTGNLRSVVQEKETTVVTRPLGRVLIFTLKGYKNYYGCEPDGLVAEPWTSPTGQNLQVYKAGPGSR